jgi:hypothetical protein
MSLKLRPDQRIEQLLHRFGLAADPASVRPSGDGIVFRFREPQHAARVLENRSLFARGRLGVLHGRQLGGLICEYRSYTNGDGCSLHIVLGRSGAAFADIDRFNPYQGPVQMLLHGVLELGPHVVRSLRRRVAACAVALTCGRVRNG